MKTLHLLFLIFFGFSVVSYSQEPKWPLDTCPCAREHDQSILNNPFFAKNKIVKVNHTGGNGYISFSSFLDQLGKLDSITYIIEKSSKAYVVGCRTIYIGWWSAKPRRCIAVRGSTGRREDVVLVGADPVLNPNFWKSAEYGGPSSCKAGKTFQIVSAEHIIFADMTMRNFPGKIIAIDGGLDKGQPFYGKDVRLHNLDLWDCGSQIVKAAGLPISSRDCILECSKLHYTDGLFVESTYQTQGLDVHRGRNWIVRDNTFLNIRMRAGTASWGTGILIWNNSDSALIERNLIMNCDFAMVLGLGTNDSTDHMTAINNLVIYNDNSGKWRPSDVFATKTRFTIHGGIMHNTVYNPYTKSLAFAVCNSALPVKNNIYVSGTTSRCASQSNNLIASESWFVDPAAFDFHLNANHTVPAVEGISQDAEGHKRANPPTAGAFEFIPVFNLTVIGGSGSGSYSQGTTVTITANAPDSGKLFDQWIGVVSGIADSYSSSTKYLMSGSDATITATYKQKAGINNVLSEVVLFPNPTNDFITTNIAGQVSIIDLNGEVKIQKHVSGSMMPIDISNLSPGMYILKVITDKKSKSVKFIKE